MHFQFYGTVYLPTKGARYCRYIIPGFAKRGVQEKRGNFRWEEQEKGRNRKRRRIRYVKRSRYTHIRYGDGILHFYVLFSFQNKTVFSIINHGYLLLLVRATCTCLMEHTHFISTCPFTCSPTKPTPPIPSPTFPLPRPPKKNPK